MHFFENVYQTMIGKEKAIVDAQEGINSMRVIDAAFESHLNQRVIHLV